MIKRLNKPLSLVLAFILIISPLGSLSAKATTDPGSAWQIKEHDENYVYHTLDNNGTIATTGDDPITRSREVDAKVNISKTISPTDQENIFNITLEVNTTQDIKTKPTSTGSAVVLIFDVSTFMDCMICGESENHNNHKGSDAHDYKGSRLEHAKTAAKDLIAQYVAQANGAPLHVSIVLFQATAKYANQYMKPPWTEATTLNWQSDASSQNIITQEIDFLKQPSSNANLEHALILAKEALSKPPAGVDVSNSSVVLFTAGTPNQNETTIPNTSDNTNAHYINPPIVAGQIKSMGATIYTVHYGKYTDLMPKNNQTLPDIVIGPWLNGFSNFVLYPDDLHFESIFNQTKVVAETWTVTDPMGQFIVMEETPSNTSATYNSETGVINWDLTADTAIKDGDFYKYTMSYKVRLNTAEEGFVADQYYLTNGYTELEYAFYDDNGKLMDENDNFIYLYDGTINPASDGVATPRTLGFKVPAVKGSIPVMNYTIEYYTENRNNLGTYTLADTSQTIPVNLWSNVNYPAGYATKFAPTHNFISSDPAVPMLINANNMVLKLKYNLVPTTVTVNHHYRTDTINIDGTTTRGTYGIPVVDPYNSGFYVGDRFPLSGDGEVALKTLDGFELVTSDDEPNPVSDARSIASLSASGNVINLYYVKTVDLRKEASVEVYKKFYNYEWQLDTTTGLYKKVLVNDPDSTIENPVSVSGNFRIPANHTVNVEESGYNRIGLTINNDPAVANSNGDVTFALAEGVNKVVVVYEKTSDPRVAANVTVNHIYTRTYTTIVDGIATTVTDPNEVVGYVDNIPMYVGETFDFDETTGFRLLYNGITYPTPGTGAGPITVAEDPTNNVINIHYLIPDSTPKTSVTVNHYYRTWESSIDPDSNATIWTKTDDLTVTLTYENMFVGTVFNAPQNPEGRTGYTMDLMKDESGVTSQTSMTLESTGNVLNIYYDAKAGEPPTSGTATAIHEYYEDVQKVDNGSVVTERRPVGSFTEVKYGATGSSHTFSPILVYGDNTDYVRTDNNSLSVSYNGSSVTLTYVRTGDSELVPTTLDVTHNYFSRTMTVTNGVAGYGDRTSDGNSNIFVVKDKGGNVLTNLYEGMQVTVDSQLTFGENTYVQRNDNPSLTFILGLTSTNSLVLNYDRDIPLPQVDITVNHTYHETVFTYPGGVEASTVVTTTGATNGMVAATKYVGEHYTASTAPGGFALTSAKHGDTDIIPTDGEYVITASASGNVINFVYEKTTGRLAPAAVTVKHFYTEVDFDGTKTGYEADPTNYVPDLVTASSYAGMSFTATPILKADEGGLNGYTLTSQDATPDFDSGLTITLAAGDENVINLYYTRNIDTRRQTAVTVNHFYSVFDTYTAIRTSEGEHNEIISSFEAGVWVGATFNAVPRTGHNERTYVLDTDISDPLSLVLVQIGEESNNTINLYYQRTVDTTPETPPVNPPVIPVTNRYSITISYKELDTDDSLAPDNVTTLNEFSTYDVTAATTLEIEGYELVSVTGDPVSGVLRSNRAVTVWYTALEDINIDDPEIPLGEEPEEETPEDPDDTVDIGEGKTPLGEAPNTSDTSDLAFMALLSLLSIGGLVVVVINPKRKRTDI